MKKTLPCGRPFGGCGRSTGIHGGITCGTGNLDEYGYWEHPCDMCQAWYSGLEEGEKRGAEALQTALKKYGQHTRGCAGYGMEISPTYRTLVRVERPDLGCTCGLDALIGPREEDACSGADMSTVANCGDPSHRP